MLDLKSSPAHVILFFFNFKKKIHENLILSFNVEKTLLTSYLIVSTFITLAFSFRSASVVVWTTGFSVFTCGEIKRVTLGSAGWYWPSKHIHTDAASKGAVGHWTDIWAALPRFFPTHDNDGVYSPQPCSSVPSKSVILVNKEYDYWWHVRPREGTSQWDESTG